MAYKAYLVYLKSENFELPPAPFVLVESRSALNGFAVQYTIDGRPGYDDATFLEAVREVVTDRLEITRQTKVKMILICMMTKINIATGEEENNLAYFHSYQELNLDATHVHAMYDRMVNKVRESLATYQMRGSGWVFKSIDSLEIHTVEYRPLTGGSYLPHPKKLASKNAIVNPKNEDNECFKWVVTRALNPVEDHPERITPELRQQAEQYNWDGITFPAEFKDIGKFEKQNPGIYVKVFGYKDSSVFPLRIIKQLYESG